MSKKVKVLTIRLPDTEMLRLESYCEAYGRTKTDVIREYIRSLNLENRARDVAWVSQTQPNKP